MSQITITAKIGPGETVTSLVTPNALGISFDFTKKLCTIAGQTYDISAATTFTMTYSSPNYTVSIS